MPRKPSKKTWKSKCDKVAGLICRHRGVCLKCGSTDTPNWAHIKSRSYFPTRWDMDNCVCLCQRCHMYYTNHPSEWELWITSVIGEEKWWDLTRRSIQYQGYYDYDAIHAKLHAIYVEALDDPNFDHDKKFHGVSYEDLRRKENV